jgi:PAS domain S-box-containing protein
MDEQGTLADQRGLDDEQSSRHVPLASGLFHGEEMVQTLLDSLAEGLVVVDVSGQIVYVNRRTQEMFGYGEDELVGRQLDRLLPGEFAQAHSEHISDFFAQPRVRPMGRGLDLVAVRKDGTEFPVEISLSALETKVGALAMAFVTDITLRKQAELELKQRNEDLDAFARTVAHDLQASLGVLVGYSEILRETHETLPPEEMLTYLVHMGRNARKMSSIVSELLLLASMDRADVVPSSLDMERIVGEVLYRLHYLVEEEHAQINLPDSYPQAIGYAPWVEEIWYNYLSNALKYGGDPPRIDVGGAPLDDGSVRFWVRDNGMGLTQEQQGQLFAPLTRLGQPQVKGQGLGLSIVKRIVTKLGGQVGVESEVGHGSTFSFSLPGPA